MRANAERLKEVLMKNPTLELLDELGITARAEARGEVRGMALGEARVRQVLDLLKSGKPPEEILQLYGEAAS
jgi:hypothetical protein